MSRMHMHLKAAIRFTDFMNNFFPTPKFNHFLLEIISACRVITNSNIPQLFYHDFYSPNFQHFSQLEIDGFQRH